MPDSRRSNSEPDGPPPTSAGVAEAGPTVAARKGGANAAAGPSITPQGGYRWTICSLLFFATTVNYVDRAVLGVLKPLLDRELGWSQVDYGYMVTAFQFAYALGYVMGGRIMDRIGVRVGFTLAVLIWSLAAIAHALARTVFGFSVARAVLGLAEGGGFPAAIKTIAEWFPKEQRAYATGWFNAGSNVGAITCPLLVPWLAGHSGWQGAFIVTGAMGLIWIFFWWWLYDAPERHPRVSAGELAYIRKDPPDAAAHIPWLRLLRWPQTWAFMVGMVASSPIWWFYIYWIPDFLNKRFGLSLTQSSVPLMLIFLGSSFGGIGGGWFSSAMIRKGWSVNAARKIALLGCALCVIPVGATPLLDNVWIAVVLVGLAAAAHCGFAANLFTLVSDTVPRQAISSVVGLGGMAGALAGMVFAQVVSRILFWTNNNYIVPFVYASVVYLIAVGIMHWILPRLEPMPTTHADGI